MIRIAIASVTVVLMLSGIVQAGVLATDAAAYVDGTSRVWHGSTDMDSGITVNGLHLQATVDWCVYAPGAFHFDGYTPTPGEFVYAYQVDVTGTSVVKLFTVALLDENKADNIGSFALGTGVAPAASYFEQPGSPDLLAAEFEWTPAEVAGLTSGLVFSSINAPMDWVGNLADSGQTADGTVPSPSNAIPEPATLGILTIGLLGWVSRRRR